MLRIVHDIVWMFNCTLKLYINIIIFHVPKTQITAAIIHGQGTCAYIDVHSWPHDSSLTINILLDILMKQFVLPILYIQLDNTARENKISTFHHSSPT